MLKFCFNSVPLLVCYDLRDRSVVPLRARMLVEKVRPSLFSFDEKLRQMCYWVTAR